MDATKIGRKQLDLNMKPADGTCDPSQATDQPDANKLDDLSSKAREKVEIIIEKLQSKEAYFGEDVQGNPTIEYKKGRNCLLNYVDQSEANKLATPKTEKDVENRLAACLELIRYFKNNKSPSGVVLDKTKVSPKYGEYHEGHEFQNLSKVLGEKGVSGDILVVKDSKTGHEHAQKTVMISDFREEEIRAWVDLDETGLPPSLYCFRLESNKIKIHMEKLEKAITLDELINERVGKIQKEAPELVRPFSLYVLHGLVKAVDLMHQKNWSHRDLHGGNVMMQDEAQQLQMRILDFGKANPIQSSEGYDVRGEEDDILQIIRLFSGLYTGELFESALDLKKHHKEKLSQTADLLKMSKEDREELFQLMDVAMSVSTTCCLGPLIIELDKKLKPVNIDDMMKQVVAILFQEDEYVSLHLGAKSGIEESDEPDGPVDLASRAANVPDDFINRLRSGFSIQIPL